MKKRNAKTLVISLALMLVMCVATALLSFSLADDTTPDSGVDASNKSTTRTNIDYIIENSHGSDKDETGRDLSPFYIVEIGSASNANNSPLKEMTLEDVLTDANADDISQFVKQVINGWSTQGKTMKPNKISYKFISASSLSNADAIQDAIKAVGQADLIYVSNDPAAIYDSSNDIAEDVKIALSNAATSTYTPFIIDSPTKTQNGGSGNVTATRNFNNLADNIFATAGYYRDAFSYNVASSKNVENYLNRLDTKSLWLPIPGKTHSDNWIQGKDAPDGTETKLSARILTIHSGDTDNAVTEKFKEAVQVEGASTTYDLANIVALDPTFDPDGKEGYVLQDGSPLKEYGYFATQVAPDNVIFEAITPADIPTTDLGVYDLIIIEKGIGNTKIDNDTYNMFSSMVYGLQHIVYDSTMSSSSGGEEQDDIVKSDAKNYQYVMEKVADGREVSRFSNVLVTGMAEMRIYGAATAPSGVKAIADIINNGGYRGSGGGGSSSNLYTVLEIQPCYPIDLNLAKVLQSNGIRDLAEKARKGQLPNYDRQDIFYYIQGDSVMNNKTSDEISFDGGVTSLSDMESTDNWTTGISARGALQNSEKITTDTAKDYYAWELSKAKVAKLTGLEYDQVNVVHMSTVEFNSSRETIMDNYDAIYIGGNYSAIKDLKYWKTEGRSNPALYQMYFHQAGSYNNGDGIGVLTGNDLTYNRYVELQEYIAAGMPLVFTKPVVEAYYAAYGTESGDTVTRNYKNKLMDPESNMFLLMRGCMSGTSSVTDPDTGEVSYPTDTPNVLAGFDPTDQVKIMNDGTLGETYGGYVTVFGGLDTHVMIKDETTGQTVPVTLGAADQTSVNAREFSELLSSSSGRPKFALLQAPPAYIEGDDSTEIRKNSITFKVDVASNEKYKINVYVDDNTNSRFETKECLYSKPGPRDTVTVTFPNTFDGALYWKFEIETTKCKSSVVGISKVHVKTPNYVNVLQIAPDDAKTSSINGKTTLLFCTECQEARGILHGNRYTNVGKYSSASAYNGPCFYDDNFAVGGTLQDPSTYDPGFNNQAKGKALGIHRHNFGIVKYDSNYTLGGWTGLDNWETNWAEDVYNDYDIDMDIWTTREFEDVVKDCQEKVTPANADDVLEKYKSLASIYKTYYLTMKEVVAGTVDTTSTNYIYLKNKLTRNDTAFVEADVNSLFGEEKGVYDLETAKGGFHVSETELTSYLTAQETMKALLLSVQGHVKSDKADKDQWTQEITYETTYSRYSDFFSMFNASSQIASADKNFTLPANFYNDFVAQFRNWRNAKVFEEYFYKMYMKYLTYSTMKKHGDLYYPDFTEVYSCIVVGVGENFGDDDIKTQAAVDTLKYYIENDGNTFIFHQTINDEGKTPMMTNNLKTLFGQNYTHVTTKAVTQTALTYTIKSGDHWNGEDPILAEGTLKESEGMDILVKCVKDDQTVPSEITVTPNATGKVNISWEVRDTNGNLTNAGWSEQKVRLYINGKSAISDAKVDFRIANRASTGTLNDQATITEKPITATTYINEDPTDTARYHYTATLDNGKSIKLSKKHLTMVNKGVWGNSEAFSQFTYTQTAILNNDIQVPNSNINFVSDMNDYGAFTNRATQINKGVVTMYPFRIASTLKISETHPNSFSTDIEDEDMVVYYALAGAGKGKHTNASVAAADPQDGIDNYFLYSYGNVTYCGAGHTLLTGRYRDNNDERRLFINIILNSSKKSVFGPTIDVFDPYPEKNSDGSVKVDGEGNPVYTNNDITLAEDGSYEMVVTSQEDIPEFDYRVRIPDSADEVQHVKIYYDLSPNASGDDYGFVKNTDVLIFESDAKNDDTILKDKHKLISKAIDALKLSPSYFTPYDNKYTYIVIAVKTKKGVIATQRIMVKVAPKLWDLT